MHDSGVSGLNAFGLSVSTAFAAKTSFDNHLLLNLFNNRTTSTSKYNHLSRTSLVTKEDEEKEEKEAEQMQHVINNKDFLK